AYFIHSVQGFATLSREPRKVKLPSDYLDAPSRISASTLKANGNPVCTGAITVISEVSGASTTLCHARFSTFQNLNTRSVASIFRICSRCGMWKTEGNGTDLQPTNS